MHDDIKLLFLTNELVQRMLVLKEEKEESDKKRKLRLQELNAKVDDFGKMKKLLI